MRLAFALLLLATSIVQAEVGLRAGVVGSRYNPEPSYIDGPADNDLGVGVQLDATGRVAPNVAFGGMVAIDGMTLWKDFDPPSTMSQHNAMHEFRPIFVGVTARYLPNDRAWLGPWIGVQYDWERSRCWDSYNWRKGSSSGCEDDPVTFEGTGRGAALAYGFGAGVDLHRNGPHRLGLSLALARGRDDYASAALMLAYRR